MPDIELHPRFALLSSAASGLVVSADRAWVVADDRCAVEVYGLASGAPGPLIELVPGAGGASLRKRDKPDFEALADIGDGVLIALGSGSRSNRERGVAIKGGTISPIDLSAIYARVRSEIDALNIEGAVRLGERLLLAHRGVGSSTSRIISVDLAACMAATDTMWPASAVIDIVPVALGELEGVPLSFTDLALDRHGALHYLAAAEHTDDPYLDGRCAGSVIGSLDQSMHATALGRLRPNVKAEGLASWKRGDGADCWLVVTDADDPNHRSTLYELEL